jgi:hypothetical protein
MRKIFKATLLTLSLVSLPALSNNDGMIGIHGGWGFPKATPGGSGGIDFGMQLDWTINPMVNAGIFISYQLLDNEALPTGTQIYEMPFGVAVNINMMGGPGFYIGGNLGATQVGTRSDASSVSEIKFSMGAQTGFDYPMTDRFAGGLELRYIYISDEIESSYLLNTNAHIKYYF